MKRILSIGVVLLLSVGLLLAAMSFWCLGTTAGTRWLAGTAGELVGVEITSAQIEGSLLDGLILTDVNISWQTGAALVDTLSLEIHPASLWNGALTIKKLKVNKLVLQSDVEEDATSDESETESAAGSLAVAPEWLEVTIDHLQITDFISRSTDDPVDETVIATLIAGQYQLSDNRLTAEGFSYHSPYVELDGDFDWELKRPHLVMTAQVHLPETCVDPDLFETIHVPTTFPGHLEFDGDWNGYSGPVKFGTVDGTGARVWLSAQATGSWRGIRFDDLRGLYLGGNLAGELDLAWIDAYAMHGKLSVQGLDPATLVEGTTGAYSFDVAGDLLVPYDNQPTQSSIDALLHNGRFRGHNLQGQAGAQWLGQELIDLDVDLASDGARLFAKGAPSQRVEVDLEVNDLATFHNELAGHARASGWLRWSGEELAGEIDGQGENLGWQGTKVRRVEFHALRPIDDEGVDIKLSGENWSRGTLHLQRLDGEVSGTEISHQLTLAAESSIGHFTAHANGSYQADNWTGALEQLTGRDTPWGAWTMAAPTNVAWNNGALSVDALQLRGDRGATIGLGLNQWGSQEQAGLSLTWSGFDLERLQAYVDLADVSGRSDGKVQYIVSGGEPLSITGQLTSQGRIEDDFFELGYKALELNFGWDEEGLQLTGAAQTDAGEAIKAKATSSAPLRWRWPVTDLEANLQWQRINLTRLNRFMNDGQLEGLSEGDFSFSFAAESLVRMSGAITAQGKMMQGDRELGPRSLEADIDWDAEQFQCSAKIIEAGDGYASLQLSSTENPALAWPGTGEIEASLKGLNLAALEPLLPEDVELSGIMDGQTQGTWRDQGIIDMVGNMQLLESQVGWASRDGHFQLPLREASAEWRWADDNLTGSFAANLADQGRFKGTWQLPLPARMPTTFNQTKPMQVTLDGRMQAIGLLSAIGPWLVQDISGEMLIDLSLQGTLKTPDLRGELNFVDGAAYLPMVGVDLEGINLKAGLAGDRVRIDQLEVHSGPGSVTGHGELILDHWMLDSYRLDLTGKNLEVFDFPELHILCDPDLSLSGTSEQLSLQGTLLIPVLTIKGSQTAPGILPSKDVVVDDKEEKQRNELNFATDIQVTVELGEKVTIDSGGVTTRMTGGGIVTIGSKGEASAHGEIQLVSGTFRAYGVNLKIRQGVLSYKGGTITNPGLRFFAAREVGEVLAGVQVTGNAEAPVITLFSQPAMPDRDILGYMLMGRALNSDKAESDILAMSTGTLMTGDEKLFSQLGITEIDIQGLFEGGGGVRLRRKIAEKWEVESTLGVESGIDLYYIIKFE